METEPASSTGADAGANTRRERTIGELIAQVSEQASSLVRDEIAYAQANLKAKITNIGVGGVLIAISAVLAVFAFTLLLFAAVAAFALILPWWASFLIVAGILLLITLILVAIGGAQFKASKKHVVDPKGGLEQDVAAFKKGLNK